jgi:A/G-specific adenine glycosylase
VDKDEFQAMIWQKGRELYRPMPWRDNTDPYYVLVSELMLQQTQVDRVVPKFLAFIERFPSLQVLADASLADVITLWNGLGYNRRAKYLHEAARRVVADFAGKMPARYDELLQLPGVGPNTAGAIMNYAYEQPVVYIETNIRTVYFHHYFLDDDQVTDAQLRRAVDLTIDREHPRQWHWALMDYGAFLKKQGVGRIAKSAHYKKQSPLAGSVREVRGQIIRALMTGDYDETSLRQIVQADERFTAALHGLVADQLITQRQQVFHLTK